jgi:hypothetical protein
MHDLDLSFKTQTVQIISSLSRSFLGILSSHVQSIFLDLFIFVRTVSKNYFAFPFKLHEKKTMFSINLLSELPKKKA